MKRPSSEAGQPTANGSDTGWQIFGELELPVSVDVHSTINTWLSEILAPLHLHVGFLDKVLKSAGDATLRAMQTETVMKYQHSHLLIYIPANRPANVETWGFFRIEKMEPAVETEISRDHSIEFYLYVEGQ